MNRRYLQGHGVLEWGQNIQDTIENVKKNMNTKKPWTCARVATGDH